MELPCTLYKHYDKNYLHVNDTEFYFQNLNQIHLNIKNDAKSEFLYFAYVTLCASTLEASLNHIIFSFYIDEFGPIDFKKYTDSLINISFSNKLNSTPNVVTKSEYYFNPESSTVKTLEELITLRNKILHKKPILQETEIDLDKIELGMAVAFNNNNHMQSITKGKCINFHKAIVSFRNEFMIPFLKKELKETLFLKRK